MDAAAVIGSLPLNERAQFLAEMDGTELDSLPVEMQNESRRARAQHVEPNNSTIVELETSSRSTIVTLMRRRQQLPMWLLLKLRKQFNTPTISKQAANSSTPSTHHLLQLLPLLLHLVE